MSAPLVSVCLPTFNSARFVGAALESALAQTYEPLEILIVDNGSTDGTLELVRGYDDPRLRVSVNERNIGLVANHNQCIRIARGPLIKFLHSDDLLEPDCVARMAEVAQRSERVGLVFARRAILLEAPDDPDSRAWAERYAQPARAVRRRSTRSTPAGRSSTAGSPASCASATPRTGSASRRACSCGGTRSRRSASSTAGSRSSWTSRCGCACSSSSTSGFVDERAVELPLARAVGVVLACERRRVVARAALDDRGPARPPGDPRRPPGAAPRPPRRDAARGAARVGTPRAAAAVPRRRRRVPPLPAPPPAAPAPRPARLSDGAAPTRSPCSSRTSAPRCAPRSTRRSTSAGSGWAPRPAASRTRSRPTWGSHDRRVVAVNTGTSALHCAFVLAGCGPRRRGRLPVVHVRRRPPGRLDDRRRRRLLRRRRAHARRRRRLDPLRARARARRRSSSSTSPASPPTSTRSSRSRPSTGCASSRTRPRPSARATRAG